jgi:prohibitin 1
MSIQAETPPVFSNFRERLRAFWERHWMSCTIALLLSIFSVAAFANRMLISVYPGQGMVLYERFAGRPSPRIYYEGFHVIAPWNDSYKYDLTFQQQTVPITALSKNGLEIHLDAFIVYRPVPTLLAHLHRVYGTNYAEKLVVPQLRSALQDIVGQDLPEQLYALARAGQRERVFGRVKRLIGGVYVDVAEVAIINVRLPAKIQEAIQAKLEAEQVLQMYDFRVKSEQKEAERKFEEAKGIKRFQEEISKGMTAEVLQWKGIEATLELSKSPNAKVVVVGNRNGLPIIFGSEGK